MATKPPAKNGPKKPVQKKPPKNAVAPPKKVPGANEPMTKAKFWDRMAKLGVFVSIAGNLDDIAVVIRAVLETAKHLLGFAGRDGSITTVPVHNRRRALLVPYAIDVITDELRQAVTNGAHLNDRADTLELIEVLAERASHADGKDFEALVRSDIQNWHLRRQTGLTPSGKSILSRN